VRPGERTVVQIPNVGLSTVAFTKHPPLAGATFVVRVGDTDVGRCTTAEDGRCRLPDDVLEAGATFCWTEAVAPDGWQPAEGTCTAAGEAGTTTTVGVDERLIEAPTPPATSPQPPDEALQVAATADQPSPAPTPATVAPPPARATQVLAAPPLPELPRTGAGTKGLAGFALVLLGAGTALVLAAGRRAVPQPSEGSQLVG
jgi:hypothetical protein